jgi:hypothetical protein
VLRKLALLISLTTFVALIPVAALGDADRHGTRFLPGSPGAGDPYFPQDGNGGYDVRHYDLDVTYDPATDTVTGVTRIRARATQNLSRFNLDLDGLTVRAVTVNGKHAAWSREDSELTVAPRRGLRDGRQFTVTVRYDGVPETIQDAFGTSGFIHTDDGALVIGEPHVAATWYPVNDHPSDKASYDFNITVPAGLEAVANGTLQDRRTKNGWTTWSWRAREPMASYLTTATVGQFDLHSYLADGIKFVDALDPDLFDPVAVPRTGEQFAISQAADTTYKRLTRTISVPAGGAQLSYWVTRKTEESWDFTFVEAHTVGAEDWTTLPDVNGHTSADTGLACPSWLGLHPFLTHYQTDNGDGTCSPTGTPGTSGTWSAASGSSDGTEQWLVDLSPYAGKDVEVSIAYASDESVQRSGVFVDDVVVSTGEGTTSFEDDGDVLDGWTVPGAPEGSEPNANDWIVGTVADTPPTNGEIARGSFARQPEILDFLSQSFGPYPFGAAGGIVDDAEGLGFALENQTRPIYSRDFFGQPGSGDAVVVHELAHQWYGDSLTVAKWKHIWLNEGFATYAEWLWSEHEGLGTAQENFDFFYSIIPGEDEFWSLTIGDPGPEHLFDAPVYYRGAMTLHQLRVRIGDDSFFRLLRTWARSQEGRNVTTRQFVKLAERISGQDLEAFFDTWLFTAGKPEVPGAVATSARAFAADAPTPAAVELRQRLKGDSSPLRR